jgi:tetratricopeptide (TPR) repeat protein
MKQILTILFLALLTVSTNGQTVQKVRKVVQVMTPQTFYLNGGARASMGGKSRTWFNISLPQNTVEWYYSFSTTKGESSTATIGLLSQLTKLYDPTGMTAIATNAIFTPTGAGVCDIYLMNRKNADAFLEKVDNWGGSFSYQVSGSRQNYKNGTVQVRDITSGNWCLGFKNPSSTEGLSITFEVVAIVEETETNLSEWSTETKTKLFDNYKKNLIANKVDEKVAIEIANCVVNKMTTEYKPSDFSNKSESQINEIEKQLAESCVQTLQGGEKTEEQKKGVTFGNLGWKAYENGDIDKAIEYSKKALEKDNSLGFVQGNLGLFYLIKNDELTAMDYYIDAISNIKKDRLNAKNTFKALIDDINEALKKYPDLKGYKEILSLLQQEYNGYK